MPTNQNGYNSRLTDEALEKRFRDTFRSQGGAELVDDLYASGVIVPVVDFTSAAEGSPLGVNLQTAWDFSTIDVQARNNTVTVTSTAGFYKLQLVIGSVINAASATSANLAITDGLTSKHVFDFTLDPASGESPSAFIDDFYVFLRSGDSLTATTNNNGMYLDVKARQVASVQGTLVNPQGFQSQ